MFFIPYIKYLFLFFLICACKSKTYNVNVSDSQLSLLDSTIYYKKKPFSGSLFSKSDTTTTYKATYLNGKKDGAEKKYFFNGKLSESKFYNKGKKTGKHQSWWNNGQIMSEYNFDNTGKHIGLQREWYSNGNLSKESNYTQGKESGTQKSWDFTGKLTSNYQVINGERFGLINSKKCKPDTYVD